MSTNDNKTPPQKTLRERTQSFRNKARRLIRMDKINDILQTIFIVNKEMTKRTKNIETLTKQEASTEKITARAEYKMFNLDPEDPDYDEKKEKAIAFVETEKVRQEATLKHIHFDINFAENSIKDYTKQIEKLDKEIETVESGETKVSIDKINELTRALISNS